MSCPAQLQCRHGNSSRLAERCNLPSKENLGGASLRNFMCHCLPLPLLLVVSLLVVMVDMVDKTVVRWCFIHHCLQYFAEY